MSHRFIRLNLVTHVALGSALVTAASADVKLTAQINMEPRTAGDQKADVVTSDVTVYIRGRKARAEIAGGRVVIFDERDHIYTLDPAKKTYSVTPVKHLLDQKSGIPSQMAEHIEVHNKVDFIKVDGTRAYGGKDTTRYSITETVSMKPEAPSSVGGFGPGGGGGGGLPPGGGGGRRGGGGGRGGGVPGGGRPGGGNRGGGVPGMVNLPVLQMDGEIYAAAGVLTTSDDKNGLLAILGVLAPSGPLQRPLFDKLSKQKLTPLYSRVTMNTAQGELPLSMPKAITWEVKSITTDAVDDALFMVPVDYQKVEPPAPVALQRPGQP